SQYPRALHDALPIFDSITMHYRLTMRDETRRDERYGLTRQIGKLLRVSRQRGMPVVVTSQVYTDIDTGAYLPLGGHMLSHNAKRSEEHTSELQSRVE